MKALILAAGVGKRLKPITDRIPKTLIKIREKPILGHILSSIKKCKIKDVLIVTGHLDNMIKDYVGSGSKWGLNVSYCYNKDYKKTENICSVKLAEKELLGNDFVMINADDLFPPTIISKIMRTPGHIVLAVDGEGTLGEEEMKVRVENGKVTSVTKNLDLSEAHGESIGIAKFSGEGSKTFFNMIDEIIQDEGPKFYFEEAFDRLATQNYPISYINVKNEPWIEIDDHFDLKWAKTPISQMILGRIKLVGRRIKSIRRKKQKKT